MSNPFRYFNSSPEVIRLVVMMYVRYPLRNVEDLLAERGIDISHETVRFWLNRFGPMFAAEIASERSRVGYHPLQLPVPRAGLKCAKSAGSCGSSLQNVRSCDGLMADVDPTLDQQILDVAKCQRVSHVHHHDQTDDLRLAVEISERIAHAPRLTQPGQPENLL